MPTLAEIFENPIVPILVIGLTLAASLRLAGALLDHWRIGNYIRDRGGVLQSCRWWPFGPGWFGEKRDRIYFVVFTDADGSEHRAYCKTSLWSGVYFTQDRVVGFAKSPPAAKQASLADEVARLREENRQLRAALERFQ